MTGDGEHAAVDAASSTTRRRMTGDERRSSILSASRHEFSLHGYHGASTARIAAAAGCSEPMLYKHFAGKKSLFVAVLMQVSLTMEATIDRVLDAPGDPFENWLAFIPGAMHNDLYAEMVGLRKLAVTVKDPEVTQILGDGMDRLRDRVARAAVVSKELGSVREDVDPEYVAWMWLGITLAGSFRNCVEGPGGFGRMQEHAETLLRSLRPYPTAT